jgi:CDP-diacylglycerol--glycerol-3-phosphate 3-phosphatidyltransferase
MRGLYGYVKAAAFIFLTGYYGFIQPESAGTWLDRVYSIQAFDWFGWLNVWLAVALLIIRGLPVIFDAIPYIQQSEPDLTESGARPGATES